MSKGQLNSEDFAAMGSEFMGPLPKDRDPEDIVVHDGPPKRFPRVVCEPVERRTKVTWCVGGKEVLTDLGDGTYEVVRWPRASIEDLERLFYVIGELLTITQPEPKS